jgi:hypothetical protein
VRGVQHLGRFLSGREEVAGVRSAHQAEPLDLVRIDRREDLADPAAERLTGDDRLVDPDLAEEQMQIVRVLLRRVIAIRPAAVTMTPLVERVHMEGRAERTRRLLPHPPIAGGGVQQDQIRSGAGPLVVMKPQPVRQGDGLFLEVARG